MACDRGGAAAGVDWHGITHPGQEAAQLRTGKRQRRPALPVPQSRRITRSMATASTAEANVVMHALTSIAIDGDPSTYEEAMNSPQRPRWQ